ncbi:MAG: bifunctional methylenetetrahydrofolate dehydrogenase/methenyltetrahydrofolate cyclohydrolase FolD [Clostridia bacterium]|nr:bifunctional methylenetetrahydrofolate dehydrogenase/methenyltetrahydrofolate cyclohydrolase FolD [Clostridia bacterium]
MTCQRLDGKALALQVREEIARRTEALKARGVTPGLAVILVGDDPASEIYVRNKGIACEKAGMRSVTVRLPAGTTQEELRARIEALNADPDIDGILVQLPLPAPLDERQALNAILPEKDVDGFHLLNAGRLLTGESAVVPCTPKGVMRLIRETGLDLSGREAVVVGRSNIVGKPMALLLMQSGCTVTVCHSKTRDLAAHTRRADVLVAAVGRPGIIRGDMVKPGAVVIDVGINRVDGKVVGDVAWDEVSSVAGWVTPVPGGVGPMTIAMLLENTVEIAERRA